MNEKLSLQNIADALAQKSGVSKKVADSFSKAFFDIVIDAFAQGEDVVKVKGLGTFKLVSVERRESVNVSNGERIVIPGYKKVSFTPEESVVEFLNKNAEVQKAEPQQETSQPEVEVVRSNLVLTEIEDAAEVKKVVEELIQVEEPDVVETSQDAFSGIDMLISTPESVEEVRLQYEEAKAKMDAAVEAACKANAEKMRLERLLERLEKNVPPEAASSVTEVVAEVTPDADGAHDDVVVESVADTDRSDMVVGEVKRQEGHAEAGEQAMPVEPKGSNGAKWFWIITLIVLLLAAIVYFLHGTFVSIDSVKDVKPAVQTSKPDKPATKKPVVKKPVVKDTLQLSVPVAADADSVKGNQAKAAKEERPAVYTMKRGESLTRISQRFYGTKDSVRAIIRCNSFADPDNVPVGAEVILP